MPGKLHADMQQARPFALIEEEAVLNIIRTAEVLQRSIAAFLRPFDLSPVQYNVLRILRGAGAAGATCSDIGERMLTHDPDITRLLDRMEARGLIVRERSREDRRVVMTRISKTGLALTESIDLPLQSVNKPTLGKLGRATLVALIASLEKVRESYPVKRKQNEHIDK